MLQRKHSNPQIRFKVFATSSSFLTNLMIKEYSIKRQIRKNERKNILNVNDTIKNWFSSVYRKNSVLVDKFILMTLHQY